jgi:outer membrane lipase/esterase
MANLLAAPALYPSELDFTQTAATNFSNNLFGRLERYRDSTGDGSSAGPLSVYGEFSGAGGTRGGRLDATGYSYYGAGGDLGVEYQASPELRIGAMGNYTGPKIDLAGGAGQIGVDAYQIAGYASFSRPHWFVDGEVAYGHDQYKLTRPGVISPVEGSTGAEAFTIAGRGGYLFDLKPVSLGPIVGLSYNNVQVGGFTEAGDPLLTYAVGSQGSDALIGSFGVQLRLPTAVAGHALNPYLDLTGEHNFMRGNESLLVTETQSVALPIVTNIAGPSQQTYGKVQAGISTAIGARFNADVDLASTFGRDGGDDYAANFGLKYRF